VDKIVELTNCSNDAAIIALHDSNNDLDRAIAALLDGVSEVGLRFFVYFQQHSGGNCRYAIVVFIV